MSSSAVDLDMVQIIHQRTSQEHSVNEGKQVNLDMTKFCYISTSMGH